MDDFSADIAAQDAAKVIMKIYHDFRQTVVEPNRWRAFRGLGLDFYRRRAIPAFIQQSKLRERAD
jgi:hypothetical protein